MRSFLKAQGRKYGHFKMKQKVFINLLPTFVDSKHSEYLDYAKDIVWVLVSTIDSKWGSLDKDFLHPFG